VAFSMIRTVDAAAEPLSTAEAKLHLRVIDTDEDTLIDDMVAAACEWLEANTHIALINQTWVFRSDRFPVGSRPLALPRPPLSSVTSVAYTDSDGAGQTLTGGGTDYDIATGERPGLLVPKYNTVWPAARRELGSVVITYVAGYGASSSAVPEDLRHALQLIVGHFYRNREAVTDRRQAEVPMAVEALLANYQFDIGQFQFDPEAV
jgi:uncharacterized phiE125 gp8 family phage protein